MATFQEQREAFRSRIKDDEILVLPGCYDALTAKIVEKQGFDAVYLSGAGISNTKLGLADVGLTSYAEMVDRVRYVAGAVELPVFADADTGYGNPLHVRRTITGYEQAGAAGCHLEDQQFPKKCGHFDEKEIVPVEEMTRKIEAAVDAREDKNFLVVARTDARAVSGLDAAIERASAFLDAGADLIFPEAPQSEGEMERFCDEIPGPVMANMVEYGKTPLLSADELESLGFDLVIFPNTLLRSAMVTMQETADHLHEEGDVSDILDSIASFDLRNELTDYEELMELEERYSTNSVNNGGSK